MVILGLLLCIFTSSGVIITSKGILEMLISLELLEVLIYVLALVLAVVTDISVGGILGIIIIIGAAAQSAIGLAILVTISRTLKSVSVDMVSLIKG